MRRAKRHKLPMNERWQLQKELLGNTDKLVSTVVLANIVADKMGWPVIECGQPRYREFAKQYLLKYKRDSKVYQVVNPKSWVYFIVASGCVKIGVSDDVDSRLVSMQTGNPSKLKLKAKIGTSGRLEAYALEKRIHEFFKDYRIRGEWFSTNIFKKLGQISEHIEWEDGDITEKVLFDKVEKSKSSY